ncbi:uncharacterized protein LOC105683896 [Athalia rosae]|uniref:uncharacterized protein LOC105683896 n=1 Tax=Athalia rosae TaxID=37344 RepID=UPI0020338EAE|nr:uncharacterized protein LOC105683896 [Athalia rosae]
MEGSRPQTGPEGHSYILGLQKDDRPDMGAEAESGEVDLHGRANNRKALERVYRLATLGITGAMRTTPTLAMGALLNLTPPHIAEAWRAALRPRFSGLWRGSGRGHTSILRLMEELIKEDISRKEDKLALLHTKGLVWFTDGSKKRGGAGTGIWSGGPRLSMSLALGNTTTVFQAEVFAILSRVTKILTLGYRGKYIYICSDSRAALRSIDTCVVRSKLVQECTALLRQLVQSNRVKLLWVPAHKGIKGNIEADRLAKRGASRHGPERGCQIGVPTEHVKKLAKRIARDKFAELWGNAPGMLHTRGLFKGPSSRLGEELIKLSRTELRSVTGLITGHWYTGKHLVHLGLREEASCPRCGEEAETPYHLLVRCGGLVGPRTEAFGPNFTGEVGIEGIGVGRLLLFARAANLTTFPIVNQQILQELLQQSIVLVYNSQHRSTSSSQSFYTSSRAVTVCDGRQLNYIAQGRYGKVEGLGLP